MNARDVIFKALKSEGIPGDDIFDITLSLEIYLSEAGFVIMSKADVEAIREALEPFAKAGELFPDDAHEYAFDQCVYRPVAGDEYALTGHHLRNARLAIRVLRSEVLE